jgi:signal transduction histidine kinase
MFRARLRLHHRIVLPVVLVAVVTTTLAAVLALSLIRSALQARVVSRLRTTATAMRQSDLFLNPAILARLAEVTGTDIVAYADTGTVTTATIDLAQHAGLLEAIRPDTAVVQAASNDIIVTQAVCEGVPCFVAYTRIQGTASSIVALVDRASELRDATQAITRIVLLTAAVGLVALVIVGQAVARRVTKPIAALVAFTESIAHGDRNRRAVVADDEVGALAAAFNAMLDRLAEAQAAIVRSEKLALTGVLAAGVAHDIRNPLAAVKLRAQLLHMRAPSTDLQTMLHDIEQVEIVVRGLLDLARPGDISLAPTDLHAVIDAVLEHLQLQLGHRKIEVVRSLSPALPPLPLDADRFRAALLNVLGNAMDAMPDGGTITLATALRDDGRAVVLEICDDGIGVDPSILDRVFDPFVTSKREGVGLGLANTKATIERHGGRITLAAREPRGTCVTIVLPVSDPANAGTV